MQSIAKTGNFKQGSRSGRGKAEPGETQRGCPKICFFLCFFIGFPSRMEFHVKCQQIKWNPPAQPVLLRTVSSLANVFSWGNLLSWMGVPQPGLRTPSGKLGKGYFGVTKCIIICLFVLFGMFLSSGDAFPSDSTAALCVVDILLENPS